MWPKYAHLYFVKLLILLFFASSCGTSDPSFNVEKTGIASSDATNANSSDPINPINSDQIIDNSSQENIAEEVAAVAETAQEEIIKEEVPLEEESSLYPNTIVFEKDGKIISVFSDQDENGEVFETVTITTEQKELSKVDILWVVDNSGSMAEEQSYLSQNFDSFMSNLMSQPVDFQLAVTTTDICQERTPDDLAFRYCASPAGSSQAGTHDQGKFRGHNGEQILHGGATDLQSKFSNYVSVGTNGSGFEHGLKAADLALERISQGTNDPLIRDDAFLAIIVISDEQDDGIGMSEFDAYTQRNYWDEGLTRFRFTEDDMIASLNQRKGEGKFAISAIVPTREADGTLCDAPHSKPKEEGAQYLKAAAKSGGMSQSICEVNWDESLAKIGLDLTAQISQIVLEGIPDLQTLKVEIDGLAYTKWQYTAGNNTLKFDPTDLPPPGAHISLFYYKAGH